MTDLATSGTYDFAPSIGECTLNALSRLRIRGPMVKAEHLHQAWMEANLMQSEWNNRGPNLWTVNDVVIPTVAPVNGVGTSQYEIPGNIVIVTNVTIGMPPNTQPWEQELTITSISRQEWTMYPNKGKIGRPTSYWFDRQIAPVINLWPVPDQVYNLHVWGFYMLQDANLRNATNFQIPMLWLDAACAGLAHRLSRHYAQDLEGPRKVDYKEAYEIAATQNVEDAPIYIVPMLSSYFR
jgi:hypothetical protein